VTNNYILRRLRYTFDFSDSKMIALFALADHTVTREDISAWLKKDDDPALVRLTDNEFALFLNGFIVDKRGKKDGPAPVAEHQINNNIIFRKLKIALNFIDEDILDAMKSVNFIMGKPELTALFRKPGHRSYRECQDQILRNFLKGVEIKFREDSRDTRGDDTEESIKVSATPDKTQMAINREAREIHNEEHGPNNDIVKGGKITPSHDKPKDSKPQESKPIESKQEEAKPEDAKKGSFQWQPIKK
jgi:uncharacterized protein YehS (DUF1456 family)